METVLEAQVEDVKSPRNEEVDEWDAKSNGPGDSISVVDDTRNGSTYGGLAANVRKGRLVQIVIQMASGSEESLKE